MGLAGDSTTMTRLGLDVGSDTVKAVLLGPDHQVTELPILRVQGRPLARVVELLRQVSDAGIASVPVGITGSGSSSLCKLLGVEPAEEVNALADGVALLDPQARAIIEMGRESQKYIRLRHDERSGRVLVEEAGLGSKCAAGTGSFLDHMHRRLDYSTIEEFARTALETDNPATLSGRCGVFTESDIVHLYQKGTPRERIVAGIHQAICRTYKTSVLKGRPIEGRVAFVGGVSLNPGARKYLADELSLDGQLTVPEHSVAAAAIGAAARSKTVLDVPAAIRALEEHLARPLEYHATEPLRLRESVVHPPMREELLPTHVARAGLGVDIGSVSTKAAVVTEVDGKVVVLAAHYRRTAGDPLSAVRDTLGRIHDQLVKRGIEIDTIVAGTTGSGRYLTADYVGADVVKNEITAQAHGTMAFAPDVDTVFEIGGQDSKYIKLSGPVIVDFEMNKACAAGTGAFLEKQAQNLGVPIEEFGGVALQGTAPPELDWQCTVFSESAMLYYQRNNVPATDLAAAVCLASARNYLNKNVAGRPVGEKVGFQGAVAFNMGMVAAMETVLGRGIVVPPYPHLTGAAGVAWIAYREGPGIPSFVGFETVAEAEYTVSSFECKACPNRCDVNTFQLGGGPRFYYNDRCERYSAERKEKRGAHLPDLFAEYEQKLLERVVPAPPKGAPRVGIPRGMMFAEYYPLWNAFFASLGLEPVPSEPTSKAIVSRGVAASLSEPCFPVKVAHGHVAALLDQDLDFLFYPGIHDTEQPVAGWRRAYTCPYLHGAPEVVGSALRVAERDVEYLAPRFHMSRGEGHVRRVLVELATKRLGKSSREANDAVDEGLDALRRFRGWIENRGAEVFGSLAEGQLAFVVVGRPYTLHDSAVNMHVGQRIRDLGVLPIPQDFLPLATVDPSPQWINAYSRQIQKKLQAARIVRADPRLRAVVITYFGCGPDSFANPFFKEELGEPCYVMQIDQHTADAGVITRMEAFADTARAITQAEPTAPIRTTTVSMGELAGTGRRVWLPDLGGAARVVAAALEACGVDAAVLPRSPDPGLNLARKAISEDVCLPALMTTEDMLHRTRQADFLPDREVFFQGHSSGPCRYGMYFMLQRRILDHLGLEDTEVVTLGLGNSHGGLGAGFVLATYDSLVAHDMLQKLLHHTRPYEVNPGQSDEVYETFVSELLELTRASAREMSSRGRRLKAYLGLHLDDYEELLVRARDAFAGVPGREGRRPLVGLVGEFYVRLHPDANQDIIRKLEAAGAEVWLAPLTEFISYSNYLTGWLAEDALKDVISWRDVRTALVKRLLARLARHDEHVLYAATEPYMGGFDDIPAHEVVGKGSRYVDPHFGGEAICSMGKAEDFADRGLDGVVSIAPFNCMPGMTVSALSHELRRRHGGIPFLVLEYDGFEDTTRETKIRTFVRQVTDAWAARTNP